MGLFEENMQRLDKKIAAIGMPESLKSVMREKAANAQEGYFYLDHNKVINGQPVQVALGFQQRGDTGKYFEPDLMGITLQKHPDNITDRNAFFLPSGDDISIREAFNLMQGRAIHRPAGIYTDSDYWMRLNQEKSLSGISGPEMVKGQLNFNNWFNRHLPQEINTDQKQAIVDGLLQGDRYMIDAGNKGKLYLVANPEKERIDLENEKRQLLKWSFIKRAFKELGIRKKI